MNMCLQNLKIIWEFESCRVENLCLLLTACMGLHQHLVTSCIGGTLLSVLSGVTVEAEAGMIVGVVWYIMQPGSQFLLAQASVHQHWAAHSLATFPARSLGFWCYSHWHGAYGLMLSVIWPPVLVTIPSILIPECNGLSQFNEDTGKKPLCLPENLISLFCCVICVICIP